MKNIACLFALLFSVSAYSQITEKTNPTELKSVNKASSNNEEFKITSSSTSNSSGTSSDQLIIKKYFDARKKAGQALKVYDKTIFPDYDHDLSEEQNINKLVKWAYKNIHLFKEEHHDKIKDYYNKL